MDINLAIICALTFVIHLIGTLAYAARIAGVRTGHIAAALTLFNLLVLVSRTSNAFQGPFLAKRIERGIGASMAPQIADFQWILGSAALATLLGMVLVPTAQRVFTRAVAVLQKKRSMVRLFTHALHPWRLARAGYYLALPKASNLGCLTNRGGLSWWFLGLNAVAVALWTAGFCCFVCRRTRAELPRDMQSVVLGRQRCGHHSHVSAAGSGVIAADG